MSDNQHLATYYAKEKYYRAASSLASGEGEINERLELAALALSVLSPQDVPAEHRDEHNSIHAALTRCEAEVEGEGTIHATIRQMPAKEASEIAERIFSLYAHLLHGSAL